MELVTDEITQYLDYPSLLAFKLSAKPLYNQIDVQAAKQKRIVPGLWGNEVVKDQIKSNRFEFEMMNPLQLRCILEEKCFVCGGQYKGLACLPLYVYGHERCIEKLLVSALQPDIRGHVPLNYLPEEFPAIVNPKRYYTCVTGRVEPVYETCLIIAHKRPMVQCEHTLEGFLQSQTHLPKHLCGEYSPKRRGRRFVCPKAPRKQPVHNLRGIVESYPLQLLCKL